MNNNGLARVEDPDLTYVFGLLDLDPDPLVKRYGSGSGSFYHQAKIVRKTLIPTIFVTFLYDVLCDDVNVSSKSNKQSVAIIEIYHYYYLRPGQHVFFTFLYPLFFANSSSFVLWLSELVCYELEFWFLAFKGTGSGDWLKVVSVQRSSLKVEGNEK